MIDICVVRCVWFNLRPLSFAHHYHAFVTDDYGRVRYSSYGLTAKGAEKRCFRRAMNDVYREYAVPHGEGPRTWSWPRRA